MDSHDANRIADGLFAIARALERLGTNDAMTSMGAVELLAKEVRDGFSSLGGAIYGVAQAIEDKSDG